MNTPELGSYCRQAMDLSSDLGSIMEKVAAFLMLQLGESFAHVTDCYMGQNCSRISELGDGRTWSYHPCELTRRIPSSDSSKFCHVDKVTHMLVDMMIVTEGIVVHWEHMAHVIEFVERLHFLVQRHDARLPLRSCVPLVHTLNKSNCVKKRMVATTFDLSDQSKAPKLLAESMWNYEI